MAIDPTDSDIVYAAGYPGFHKTTDGGDTWQNVSGAISGNTYAVVVDYSDPSIVYTGGTNGLFKSTNSGNTWVDVGLNAVNAVLIDPDDHNTIYAGTATGVYMSTNGGDTWEAMSDGLEDFNVTSLGIFPNAYLFCGTDISGMYRWDISTGMEELTDYNAAHTMRVAPNPMRHSTAITYHISSEDRVTLAVYDSQGRFVRTLVSGRQAAGMYTHYWDAVDAHGVRVSAGVYFFRLKVGTTTNFLKLVVTR